MDLFIDCEWYINQRIFLLGYCYSNKKRGQLYDAKLTKKSLKTLLSKVGKGYIFFYGPDIGMLEKHFNMNIRSNYKCVNLIKVFMRVLPKQKSYKLAALEKKFGIKRSSVKYKKSILKIFADWKNPKKKQGVLDYNKEDAINLLKLYSIIAKQYKVKPAYLDTLLLE